MTPKQTFSILFWLEKNRVKNGKASLIARITVNGKRAEISTHRKASILEWNPEAQIIISKSQEAKDINNHLAIMKVKILNCQSKLEARGETITAEAIKNEYVGKRIERRTICQGFAFKLRLLKEEVARKKKAEATYDKYDYTLQKIKSFLKHNFKVSDKPLDEIRFSFINDFEHYLSITLNLDNNTTMKYISRTKTVFKMAVERDWIPSNPIASFRCSFIEREPLRLELDELYTLYEKPITIKRLEEARDIYVFMCFTGFAYIDTFGLTSENIFWGIDKQKWITKNRQKTEGAECVPLLPIPLEIIEKYKTHPYCCQSGKLLPVNSNQKFNGYLKEIAAICGINKELTTHTGRHTFATTVTLENDVPLETVGKMLGHRSIKSTQRYARVTKKKISNNMNDLRSKLFPLTKNVNKICL
jgi:site-specific recombinase XerD